MFGRLQAGFWHTAVGPTVVIWGFGYILVDIVGYLIGNSAPGTNLFASVPLFILGVTLTLALDYLGDQFKPRSPAVRWLLLTAGIIGATVIQSLFDLYWIRWVSLTIFPEWQGWALIITLGRLLTAGIVYLWTFCLALAVLWATQVRAEAEASAARAASAEAARARAEASLHRAQSAALRLQLNPHFLFNTLNSISSLVVLDRKDEAEEMIELLCDFLRASLNADPMADVPLAQEIDSVDSYLGIEAARFGERLEVEIAVDPSATNAQVPNFILQPLVENAIKHGVAAIRGAASVTVAAAREGDDLVLSVVNSAPDAEEPLDGTAGAERPRTGIGLSNIRQRLMNSYGESARLETISTSEGYRAVIRLPFISASRQPA